MNSTRQIAKHVREVHFGGNWACTSLKSSLAEVTWEQAKTQVHSFNTIATLVFHINYYVEAVLKVLQGNPLDANDKYSFDAPTIHSKEDWEQLLEKTWHNAEAFANLIETLPDSILNENLSGPKYGNYFRNLHGIIEHSHYHLGQIVIIKKLLVIDKQ